MVTSTASAVVDPARSKRGRYDLPPMLAPSLLCTAEVSEPWFAVESGFLRALAWQLLEMQLPYFLPKERLVKRVDGVRREWDRPRFPGYIFAAGQAALEYCGRSRFKQSIVTIHDQKQFRREIASLEIALEHRPMAESCDDWRKGQLVRIASGPFEGMEGHLEDVKDAGKGYIRLGVMCSMMGRGVVVEVDRDDVERI